MDFIVTDTRRYAEILDQLDKPLEDHALLMYYLPLLYLRPQENIPVEKVESKPSFRSISGRIKRAPKPPFTTQVRRRIERPETIMNSSCINWFGGDDE